MPAPLKPNRVPRWAINDVIDPTTGKLNKIIPSDAAIANGFYPFQPGGRRTLNYLFYYSGEWLNYLSYYHNMLIPLNKAQLPVASNDNKGAMYYINDVDSGCVAVSDGTNWKKISFNGNV